MRPFCICLVILNSVLSSVINPSALSTNWAFQNDTQSDRTTSLNYYDNTNIISINLNPNNISEKGKDPISSKSSPLNSSSGGGDGDSWTFIQGDDKLNAYRYRRADDDNANNKRKIPAHENGFPVEYNIANLLNASSPPPVYPMEHYTAYVNGLRVEDGEKGVSYANNGRSEILADTPVLLRLFGTHFSNHTIVRFVTDNKSRGEDCDDISSTKSYQISKISENFASAIVDASFTPSRPDEFYYICVRENNTDMPWVHQGPDTWLSLKAQQRFLPVWAQSILICVLLLFSGLFAGLTLGLLSLDTTSLKILANTGEEKQRIYAKTILPLRSKGNFLLCSLVLGNVLVNSTLTIILDDLTTGLLAVTISTAGIVVFGEIIPQAVCSRNGLAIGARTVWLTKFIMVVTFPLSFSISFILDKVLGEEIGIVYNREKFKELINVTENDLEADEVNTIKGALDLKLKNVEQIMTRLEDIFMLSLDAILDFELLTEIRRQGYSRIPIYQGEKNNIVALLFTKDLIFVDPDDKISLKTLVQYYNNPCFWIQADSKLDRVFKTFKNGQKGHMAFVQRLVTTESEKDPFCETVGLVTLEDVIEELIQSEIVDEDDMWMDNRSKRKMPQHQKQDFSKFFEIRNSQKSISISPQLALAAFQFLSAVVEPFLNERVSEEVLHQVLKRKVFFKIRKMKETPYLYEKSKATDNFTLILEGRVEVTAGKENLKFENGPFTFFGVPSILCSAGESQEVPDYTVQPVTDVTILRVPRALYQAAVKVTSLMKTKTCNSPSGESIEFDHINTTIDNILKTMESEIFADPLCVYATNTLDLETGSSSEESLSTTESIPETTTLTKFLKEP